jgi:hypothetical protein
VKFSGLQQELRSRSRSRARSKTCTPNGDGTNVTAVAGGENSRNRFRHSPSAAAGAAPTPNPQTGSSLRSRARSLPGPTQARPTEPNKWMAPKPKRFGIKKAWQKMRAASRVGAGLQRWLSRGRAALQAAALARSRAPAEIVATPPPPPPLNHPSHDAMLVDLPVDTGRELAGAPAGPSLRKVPAGVG